MSHSRRKRPYAAWCGGSQKEFKTLCNRMMRRASRVALRMEGEDAVYEPACVVYNNWGWPQDGTRHYAPYRYERTWQTYRQWYRWALTK